MLPVLAGWRCDRSRPRSRSRAGGARHRGPECPSLLGETHALTTDTVVGLLVVALTVLIVNQILSRRQLTDRSRAVAVQAGIVLVQARRSVKSVFLVTRDGAADQDSARDELRTYSIMLLVSAPVLIEDRIARKSTGARACRGDWTRAGAFGRECSFRKRCWPRS